MSTKSQPPSRTAEQFVVRFPDGMRDTIAALAKKNGRSMNAEIVARLERTLNEDVAGAVISAPAFMVPFMARIEQLVAEHGIEYVFPEEDHEGKKRRMKKSAK